MTCCCQSGYHNRVNNIGKQQQEGILLLQINDISMRQMVVLRCEKIKQYHLFRIYKESNTQHTF